MSSGASVSNLSFSFQPSDPPPPAAELLAEIRERGGRVFRMVGPDKVFCLTDSGELAEWLGKKGGKGFAPPNADQTLHYMPGAFERARGGKVEYDIYIHTIPVEGSLWEELG